MFFGRFRRPSDFPIAFFRSRNFAGAGLTMARFVPALRASMFARGVSHRLRAGLSSAAPAGLGLRRDSRFRSRRFLLKACLPRRFTIALAAPSSPL